jgi:hypothetical protein
MDGKGYDRVRRTEIGKKNFKLTHFEEVCEVKVLVYHPKTIDLEIGLPKCVIIASKLHLSCTAELCNSKDLRFRCKCRHCRRNGNASCLLGLTIKPCYRYLQLTIGWFASIS